MADQPGNQNDRRARLSALVDGQVDAAEAAAACSAWRDDSELRAAWHAYHLIGDVLRSDDLARPAGGDEAFLHALRARLATEPVVLAPRTSAAPVAPPAAAVRSRRRWLGSAAVAAGVVTASGVFVMTRVAAPEGGGTLASVTAPATAGPVQAAPPPALANAQRHEADGKLVRDARLDRYLAAHKQFGDSSAVGLPGGVLRSSVVAPAR